MITEDWALFTHRLHLVQDAVDAGYQVGIATKITTLKADIEALGVDTFDWQISRKSTNIYSEAKMLFRLRKIIKLFQPDLIHAVAIKPVIYSGALLVIVTSNSANSEFSSQAKNKKEMNNAFSSPLIIEWLIKNLGEDINN